MRIFILILAFVFFSMTTYAQCAMCRATIENNISEGHADFAASLNAGILYLFIMPYLVAGIIIFLWFRASKKNERKFRVGSPRQG
jgi:hypothetical protein